VRPDGPDLLLTLDPRTLALDALVRIGSFTEPVQVDPEHCTYRLTARTARMAFEDGLAAGDLGGVLRELTGEALPLTAGQRIQGWWEAFSRLRFYTGVTLFQFNDDFTLTELLTTTDLGSHILYQFSPRLVAVADAAVDSLLAALTRAGHTPRIVDESQPPPAPAPVAGGRADGR
jgi:hypothetical protein